MVKTSILQFDNLERRLLASRLKLQTLWNRYGFTNAEVLAASIEFDELLNQYQKKFCLRWETQLKESLNFIHWKI